jgi:hypothetical protein
MLGNMGVVLCSCLSSLFSRLMISVIGAFDPADSIRDLLDNAPLISMTNRQRHELRRTGGLYPQKHRMLALLPTFDGTPQISRRRNLPAGHF